MLARNVHPKIVSERAGHSAIAIMLNVHSRAIPSMQDDAAKIGDVLRTPAGEPWRQSGGKTCDGPCGILSSR
jgi:hypothetical protein